MRLFIVADASEFEDGRTHGMHLRRVLLSTFSESEARFAVVEEEAKSVRRGFEVEWIKSECDGGGVTYWSGRYQIGDRYHYTSLVYIEV